MTVLKGSVPPGLAGRDVPPSSSTSQYSPTQSCRAGCPHQVESSETSITHLQNQDHEVLLSAPSVQIQPEKDEKQHLLLTFWQWRLPRSSSGGGSAPAASRDRKHLSDVSLLQLCPCTRAAYISPLGPFCITCCTMEQLQTGKQRAPAAKIARPGKAAVLGIKLGADLIPLTSNTNKPKATTLSIDTPTSH